MYSVLKVSRSGYSKWRTAKPGQQATRKVLLLQRITYYFQETHVRYGCPKITILLQREGRKVSELTVGKYMRELSFRSCVAKKFRVNTTDSNHELPIAPNLLNQQFAAEKPKQTWVANMTYIPCREGRMYLASVLDYASGKS
jgi:transposase InsO family protein